jgi:hypothetical protein
VFSLSGSELEAGAAGGGEGRVPLRELFPRGGLIVTNLGTSSRAVVRFYNKRGTAEQSIKEGKRCESDRLQPRRRLALPTQVATSSLTSLQQRLVKSGGRLIQMHATAG